jgi:hypothetical protein
MITTPFDPARVLGCDLTEAERLMRGHVVTPGEVESVALRSYPWRRHVHDPDSYWVTIGQAADLLGLTPGQVKHLLDHHRLPYVTHCTGVRLMRRNQIRALAGHVHPR